MNLCIILLGSCFGSFFLVIAERIPIGLSLISPPSHCLKCKTNIKFWDLIPVISFIILKGRCRYCKTKLPYLSLIIEILTPLIFYIIYYRHHFSFAYLPMLIVLLTSIILSLTDILYLTLCPSIFFTGYGLGLIIYSLPYYHFHFHFLTSLSFYLVPHIFSTLFKNKIGLGDIKLIGIFALILHFYNLIYLIFYASFSSLLYFLFLNHKYSSIKEIKIPFVPFLTLGYFIIFIQ